MVTGTGLAAGAQPLETPSFPNAGSSAGERLTYRFQGRDFRLTDVEGEVVKPLLL